MLNLDLSRLTEEELSAAVAGHCSGFGHVMVLKMMPAESGRDYRSAVVRMTTRDEADALAAQSGDSQYGSTVIIRIAPPGKTAPPSRRGNGRLRSRKTPRQRAEHEMS